MNVALAVVLGVELCACLSLVGSAWRGHRPGDGAVRTALAFGLFAVAASIGTWFGRRAGFDPGGFAAHAIVAFALVLPAVLIRRLARRRWAVPLDEAPAHLRVHPTARALVVGGAAVTIACAAVGAVLHLTHWPTGGWDAWWMWNTKARLLHLHPGPWDSLAENLAAQGHPDYPLLLPGFVAAGLDLVGADTIAVPIVVDVAFVVATACLVWGALRRETSSAIAWIGCACLLGYHRYLAQAFDQTADVPLGLFVLAGIVLLRRSVLDRWTPAAIAAGVALGGAAWTKNEGLLALAAVVLSGAVMLLRPRPNRAHARTLALLAVGAIVPLVVRWSHDVSVGARNDLVAGWFDGTLHHVADLGRHGVVFATFADTLLRFGQSILVPLIVVAVWSARRLPRVAPGALAWEWPALAVGFVLIGDYLVFVTSPADPAWHMQTALVRVVSQLWPSLLVLLLLRTDDRLLLPRR